MSTPTLTNVRDFPPGGYIYREVSLNWINPEPLQGLEHAAMLLQTVRLNNPASGLDPTYSACLEAVKLYTCTRLDYDPRFCGLPPEEMQAIAGAPKSTPRRGCASCGRRK